MSFIFESKLKEEPLDEKEYWKNRCSDLEQEVNYVNLKYSELVENITKNMEYAKYNEDLEKLELIKGE